MKGFLYLEVLDPDHNASFIQHTTAYDLKMWGMFGYEPDKVKQPNRGDSAACYYPENSAEKQSRQNTTQPPHTATN
jgi:hypothetical protein